MRFLGENEFPFCIVFTKSDKLNSVKINKNLQIYKKKMLETGWESMPQSFVTSATEKSGRDELLNYIEDVNGNIRQSYQ